MKKSLVQQLNIKPHIVDEKSMALYLKQLANFLISLQKEGVFDKALYERKK